MPEKWARIDELHQIASQSDLSGISHHEFPIGENTKDCLHVWETGRDLPEVNLEWGQRMLHLIAGVVAGEYIVAEIVQPTVSYEKNSLFEQTWAEFMPEPVIPYDMEHRRTVFSKTFERLAPFVEKWERLAALRQPNYLG